MSAFVVLLKRVGQIDVAEPRNVDHARPFPLVLEPHLEGTMRQRTPQLDVLGCLSERQFGARAHFHLGNVLFELRNRCVGILF